MSGCLTSSRQSRSVASQLIIDKRVIERFEKEAAEMNKRSFKYTWAVQ